MTTTELEGQKLLAACCTAMGGLAAGWGCEDPEPDQSDMLAWLQVVHQCIILGCYAGKVTACAASAVAENVHAEGRDIEEALRRLVVAVAAKVNQ